MLDSPLWLQDRQHLFFKPAAYGKRLTIDCKGAVIEFFYIILINEITLINPYEIFVFP